MHSKSVSRLICAVTLVLCGKNVLAQDDPALQFAEAIKQSTTMRDWSTDEYDPLVAWPDDMKAALYRELKNLGHDEAGMAAAYAAIQAEKDPSLKKIAIEKYNKKYTDLALAALFNLSASVKRTEATKHVEGLAAYIASQPRPNFAIGPHILFIFQHFNFGRGASRCLTGMTQVMCLLAQAFGKECVERYPSAEDLLAERNRFPASAMRWHPHNSLLAVNRWRVDERGAAMMEQAIQINFESRDTNVGGDPFAPLVPGLVNTDYARSGNLLRFTPPDSTGSYLAIGNSEPADAERGGYYSGAVHQAYEAGFSIPIKASYYSMCVGLLDGNRINAVATTTGPGSARVRLSADFFLRAGPYTLANASPRLHYDGSARVETSALPAYCSVNTEVGASDWLGEANSVHSGWNLRSDIDYQRNCWFKNLGGFYRAVFPVARFPATDDLDTRDAANVQFVSRIEAQTSESNWGWAFGEYVLQSARPYILIVRDWQ